MTLLRFLVWRWCLISASLAFAAPAQALGVGLGNPTQALTQYKIDSW